MAMWVVCDRLLNEVMNLRCVRDAGHSGPCSYKHRSPFGGEEVEKPVDWEAHGWPRKS